VKDLLYLGLVQEAERARWRFDDIRWAEVDPEAAEPALRQLVHAAVRAELSTYSATTRFMTAFADDVDFTQWVSVWFYEETRHPAALARWLDEVGDPVEDQVLRDGRLTYPFASCPFTTLVLNVIAEMQAAAAYLALAEVSTEPVLREVCHMLARDEARHASHFLRYAERRRATSAEPVREARRVLTVLITWLEAQGRLRHPGQLALSATRAARSDGASPGGPGLEHRVCSTIGLLLGLDALREPGDARQVLASLRREGTS